MQQTKKALFGAPCTPVIDEEEPCTRKRARRHTVTNGTPSYSQKELPSFLHQHYYGLERRRRERED